MSEERRKKVLSAIVKHFIQTAERAGLPAAIAEKALGEIAGIAEKALTTVEKLLPAGRLEEIHSSVQRGFVSRLARI